MPGGNGKTITRKCDCCDAEYQASVRRLARGWDHSCSKLCSNLLRAHGKGFKKQTATRHVRQNSRSKFKEQMRDKNGRKCQRCGKPEAENGRALEVHRVIPSVSGGSYTEENVEVLCIGCHKRPDQPGPR